MKDIKSRLIDAAVETFAQYGVKKTAMADIAESAGVSRQSLYANFENKDEMLAAAMTSVVDDIVNSLQLQWKECTSVEQKLTVYFDTAIIGVFDMLQSKPDAKDILRGVGELSQKVAKDADKKKTRILAAQLMPHAEQLASAGTTPTALAQFIVATSSNLKFSVASRRELVALLRTLQQSVLAMTSS